MPPPEDFTRLNRRILLATLASLAVLLAGLLSILLSFNPSLVRVSPDAIGSSTGRIVWLVFGLLLTACGAAFLYTSLSWPAQLKRVVRNTRPESMQVHIEIEEDSASTTCFAVIAPLEAGPGWRAQLWVYPPEVKEKPGEPCLCQVYKHPRLERPVAVQHPHGMLWIIAGSGAVTRLD